jgi:hypothetical protein
MAKVLEAAIAGVVVALVAGLLAARLDADGVTVGGVAFLATFVGVVFGARPHTRTRRRRRR